MESVRQALFHTMSVIRPQIRASWIVLNIPCTA